MEDYKNMSELEQLIVKMLQVHDERITGLNNRVLKLEAELAQKEK
jgi:ribosomal protein S18